MSNEPIHLVDGDRVTVNGAEYLLRAPLGEDPWLTWSPPLPTEDGIYVTSNCVAVDGSVPGSALTIHRFHGKWSIPTWHSNSEDEQVDAITLWAHTLGLTRLEAVRVDEEE